MKRIRFVELWSEIKVNIIAFFSIAMFVSLGIGLFLGIQWCAVALRIASLNVINEGNMHDVSIQFPYGMTDDDIRQIEDVEGVSEVEVGYSAYAVLKDGSTGYTLKLQSLPQRINTPYAISGNLPVEKNEIALLRFWAEDVGLAIGDKITLEHDESDDAGDADGLRYLNSDTYLVTALVDTPEYIWKNTAGLGASNIGAGTVDCVGFVPTEAFDVEQFEGGYPNAYVRCSSLEGLSVFNDEYKNGVAPIVDELTELGGTLGTARYKAIHDKAQDKIDEAQAQIDDGEKQLAEGQQQIDDGEKQLAEGQQQIDDGEKQLVDSVTSGTSEQTQAQLKLEEAYRELANGQAKYDASMDQYNSALDTYAQLERTFGEHRSEYDSMVSAVNDAQGFIDSIRGKKQILQEAIDTYEADPTEENWDAVVQDYRSVKTDADALKAVMDILNSSANGVGSSMGMGIAIINGDSNLPDEITPENAHEVLDSIQSTIDESQGKVDSIRNTSITVSGTTIWLMDIPGGLQQMHDSLNDSKVQLDDAKRTLDTGWDEYYRNKAAYDQGVVEGQAKLQSSQQALEDGKATLEEKAKELEDGKATLEEKAKELEDGKAKVADAQDQLDKLEEYEWVILPRQGCGAILGLIMVTSMLDNVRWAMALLFILVGLFVCYSAISRLVHEQIIQVGTKKALGFRTGEVTLMYMLFSTLAVFVGVLISILLAIFVVEGIANPASGKNFCLPEYPPFFSLRDLLILSAIELLLILASTWFATHGLLKRDAVDLLRGESTANVKERFYERWGIWQRMSLFSQTVVNNCVNDTRRVLGTLVGVVGCTALIVVAVTLSGNIANSFTHHYETVYSFDSIAYLTEDTQENANSVRLALMDRGISSAPTYMRSLQIRKNDGTRNVISLIVPTSEDSFSKFYHVESIDGGEANIEAGGIWLSRAYAEHQGAKVGDEITMTEFNGNSHTFRIAGFYNHYLIRYECVLSQNEYREAFGNKPAPNSLLVNLDGADINRTRDALSSVDGYETLVDDKNISKHDYDELNNILNTMVLIYLILSALMALMVLLNLDIMFVDEKKRELIVLMICGFSVKDAKAYIYRDSIVLTIIGILLGVILGGIIGGITVRSLEAETVYWIKDFNVTAGLVGAIGAGVFAAGVLIYALRRIPRFELTDINRF